TIPQNNQKVKLYKFYRGINERTQDSLYANLTFRFKKIDIEIRDGYFHDIRVFLEDEEYNTHVFTNLIGISLLNYYKRSLPIYFIWGTNNNKFLNYQYSIRKNTPEMLEYTDTKLINFCIKATDVLRYTYTSGNHYIPHDLVLQLPVKDKEGNVTNLESNVTYQIKQETHLEKIVELRTYTDFLALFEQSSNGLAQIEGKSKFYLLPFPFRYPGLGQIEFFPSFSSYVNYSRFEKNNKYVEFIEDLNSSNVYLPKNELNLIEKRFLTMGIDLEIYKFKNKNLPLTVSVYGTFNYNISEANF